MCLTTLTKTDKTIAEGYKCFERIPWHDYALRNIHQYTTNLEINRWFEARQQLVHVDETHSDSKLYMSGFHFFETLFDARIYANSPYFGTIIKKVLVQEITASGTQWVRFRYNKCFDLPCHVAFRMLILPGDYQTCFTEPEIVLPRRR
jgi:hypothetical protein